MGLRRPPVVQRQARAVAAAGERLRPGDPDQMKKLRLRRQQWQEEAWSYYDEIGEIKYAVTFKANAISKAKLYAGLVIDPEKEPVDLDSDEAKEAGVSPQLAADAQAQLERLQAPIGGQAEILRMEAANFDVAGEFYLIGLAPQEGMNEYEEWDVYSVEEVRASGSDLQIVKPGGTSGRKITAEDFAARMWRRHPRSREMPDSGLRGVLSSCEGLLILDRTIRAIAKSRATSGFLLVPDELSFGNPDPTTDQAEDADEDPFHEELVKAMTSPVLDEGSASAVVPMKITGKGDSLEHFRLVESVRKIDNDLLTARDRELTRIGQGLDLPVEFMTGMAQANHWTAWLIDDSLFRAHLEPVLVALCDFKTQVFLQPGLVDAGHGQDPLLERIVIWYDATPLITRTSIQEDAKFLHSEMALSDSGLRAVLGFDESDAPDVGELNRRLIQHQRTWDPTLIRYMLQLALGTEFQPPPPLLPGHDGLGGPGPEPLPEGEPPGSPTPAAERAAKGPPPTDTKPGGPADGEEPPKVPLASIMGWAEEMAPGFGEQLVVEALKRRYSPERVIELQAANGNGNGHRQAKPSNLGEHLARIDRALMHKLLAASDAAMRRAIERAGAKLRSKPGMPKEVTASRTIPNVEVGSFLSPRLLRAAGFASEEDLLAGSFDDFAERYSSLIGQSQETALQVLTREGDLTEEQLAELRARMQRDRAASWDWFAAALTDLAAERLYQVEPVEPERGEFTPKLSVPAVEVREAMARAGGSTDLERTQAGGLVVEARARPAGGVALGDAMRGALGAAGFEERGFIWQHDDPPRDFMPHVDLDGLDFEGWDDEVLANEVGWPDVQFFYPGDHEGCLCQAIPKLVLSVPGTAEGDGGGGGDDQAAEEPADLAASGTP